MNVRFYHARILTMQEPKTVFEGEVWVRGERITLVGNPQAAAKKLSPESMQWDREINCDGNLLMPGFKNAHTHSPMTFLRSYADDLPLQEWLNKQVFPMEAKLSEEDMYILTKLAIMEYLTSGITSNFDMYLVTKPRAAAAQDCGFRTVICGSVNDFTGSVQQLEQEYLQYQNPDSLVTYQLGFHAEYTTSLDKMEGIAALAQKHHAPVFMHLCETKNEVQACRRRYGKTPVELLDQLGMFQYGGGGFHCVHVSENDLELIKQYGVTVISNPASNMKLASGVAPVSKMQEMGIPVALGTDGAASNNCLDMFREMFLVTGLQKLYTKDAAALSADKVLDMAVSNAAAALGLTDCDSIAVGKKADLILIDLHRPNMQPENNLIKNLVYSGSKENIRLTMVNGKILYEEHKFDIGADPEEIYRKSNEIITRLKRA